MEAAITHLGLALPVRATEGDRADWAETQILLAIAWFHRQERNPSSNIEQAISLLRQVMRICRGNAEICATTANHLGVLYRNRIAGRRSLNIERALACYRRSLRWRGREADPVGWAMTLNNLAAALEDRVRGDRAENLEQAIRCHEQALKVRTREEVLIPSGNLGLLPLCAATDGTLALGTAPSARALLGAAARLQASGPEMPSLAGIADPSSGEAPLTFAAFELAGVSRCFSPAAAEVLVGDEATEAAARALLPGRSYIHLACHGRFDPRQPLESALLLAQGGHLRVGDLLDGRLALRGARLAVLSACQSAIGDYREVPDEAMGLPAGFLAAGVAGVIGTLWPVPDLSTALLLAHFYELHLVAGDEPAVALGRAQRWLQGATAAELGLAQHYARAIEGMRPPSPELYRAMRYHRAHPAERPFAHPYFWAGFVYVGA